MKNRIMQMASLMAILWTASCSNPPVNNRKPFALTQKGKTATCITFASMPDGNVALSWAETDTNTDATRFYFARWNTDTEAFENPVAVPLEKNTSYNQENKPMLVFQTKDSVWAIYSVSVPTAKNKFAGFIHYRVSADGGHAWTQPQTLLQDTVPGKSRSFANAIRLPNGHVAFAWMGGMLGGSMHGRALYYVETNGKHFSAPVLIDSFACPCCRNAMAATSNGKVAIAYRSVRKGNIRDIAFAYKPAGKEHFSRPVVFSNDQWQINACPEDGPSIVATEKKNWIGWFTGNANKKGVYYAQLDNQGQVIQKEKVERNSRFIQIARMPSGKNAVVYNNTMMMGGKNASMIELSKTEDKLLSPQELDTAGYFATHPVLMPVRKSGHLLTAWLAEGRVWYKLVR